jgi:ABC-type sulfate transport system substrate-binding protein
MTIHKYQYVNDLVREMTSNRSLQTFYTLYLMAEKEEDRQQINKDFKQAWQSLNPEELIVFKQEFTESFKQLLPIAQKLHEDVKSFPRELKQAA